MGDEDEAFAVADAGGPPSDALGVFVLGDAVFGLGALRHVAAIVHGFGGLDAERGGFRELVHEGEDLLVLLGQEVVLGGGAAGDDEEEQAPHLGADFLGDLRHFGQPVHVAAGDGGLKLGIETDIARVTQGKQGAVEGARDAAEIVVRGGVGPIEADGHAGDAGFLESASMASAVSSGVALGVTLVRRPILTL